MSLAWTRLIRFEAFDGRVLRGQPIARGTNITDLGLLNEDTKLEAQVLKGEDIYDVSGTTRLTDEIVAVSKVLWPLTAAEVPILRCAGLNYAKHVKEGNRAPPPFPSIFFKPNTTVAGHNDIVTIPKIAQDDQADYEGELCIIIGRDAKDVSREEALSYVAAYTFAGGIPQWGFSKGFDTFAPLGPCLVAASQIPDPAQLRLKTTIDGEVRQDETVGDLLFDCSYLISYLSQGTTLQKGSVIMTGTPGGVGAALNPPKYLVPGTQMEVYISEIGTLRNSVAFA